MSGPSIHGRLPSRGARGPLLPDLKCPRCDGPLTRLLGRLVCLSVEVDCDHVKPRVERHRAGATKGGA